MRQIGVLTPGRANCGWPSVAPAPAEPKRAHSYWAIEIKIKHIVALVMASERARASNARARVLARTGFVPKSICKAAFKLANRDIRRTHKS